MNTSNSEHIDFFLSLLSLGIFTPSYWWFKRNRKKLVDEILSVDPNKLANYFKKKTNRNFLATEYEFKYIHTAFLKLKYFKKNDAIHFLLIINIVLKNKLDQNNKELLDLVQEVLSK